MVGIRSALVRGEQATLFAGCGIVADSDPAKPSTPSRAGSCARCYCARRQRDARPPKRSAIGGRRVRGRAGSRRACGRVRLSRLALDAAGDLARRRGARHQALDASRRALGGYFALGLARATARAGRPAGHVRHGRRQLSPGRRRGQPGARAAGRAYRRPPARAARRRRRPDDRSDPPVRQPAQLVLRSAGARADAPNTCAWCASWRRVRSARPRPSPPGRCTSTGRSASHCVPRVAPAVDAALDAHLSLSSNRPPGAVSRRWSTRWRHDLAKTPRGVIVVRPAG